MKWVKINDNVINVEDGSVQLSMGSHASIYLSIDISKNPSYHNFFIKLYESQNSGNTKSSKFDLISSKFQAIGSLIKSIDTDFNNRMNISIKCDYFNPLNIEDRRNEIINDILDISDEF
jgi:hypothetical protein